MEPLKIMTIPINALFDESGWNPNPLADPRPMLNRVDVIMGVDVMTRNEFLVYGRTALEEVERTNRAKCLSVVRIELDQETDELEKLLALVHVIKGQDDYTP